MNMKRKYQIATILAFIAAVLYAHRSIDFKTIVRLMSYALLIMMPIAFFAIKYKEEVKKIPKGIAVLIIPIGLFFWQWLHSVSFEAEIVLGFTVILLGIIIAFLLPEKDFKNKK